MNWANGVNWMNWVNFMNGMSLCHKPESSAFRAWANAAPLRVKLPPLENFQSINTVFVFVGLFQGRLVLKVNKNTPGINKNIDKNEFWPKILTRSKQTEALVSDKADCVRGRATLDTDHSHLFKQTLSLSFCMFGSEEKLMEMEKYGKGVYPFHVDLSG